MALTALGFGSFPFHEWWWLLKIASNSSSPYSSNALFSREFWKALSKLSKLSKSSSEEGLNSSANSLIWSSFDKAAKVPSRFFSAKWINCFSSAIIICFFLFASARSVVERFLLSCVLPTISLTLSGTLTLTQ